MRPVVWIPYEPKDLPALPDGLDCHYWDGTDTCPTPPEEVRFLTGFPGVGGYETLVAMVSRARCLEVLQVLSSGHDYLAPHLGLLPPDALLCTGRGVHAEATAELAVTLLLASAGRIPRFVHGQRTGAWAPAGRLTLRGKRVVVVGAGAVGTAVARLLEPFGCDLVRVARSARPGGGAPAVHAARELPSLLPAADAVVLCAPLTEETRGMFGAHRLASLKDGAILVNVGRGELVDTDALTREVSSGRLRAALDVVAPEPLPGAHPLWRQPEALITPHVGAFTDAFAEDSAAFLVRQLRRYVDGAPLLNAVAVG
ncbi:NAD(P)-dependent oxidoreductase [Streptomyces sp. enrichment culture]|uniref:NAD(P)-dependent oxidoreductase n=1 Tax=Streptomyces sp. enrichment culture TaxID=1795815 RepID=UPI003F57F85A